MNNIRYSLVLPLKRQVEMETLLVAGWHYGLG